MENQLWVVYKMTVRGNSDVMNAVCEQGEWDALERARPGYYQVVKAGITSEGAAERLARGTSGDPVKPRSREKILAPHLDSPKPIEAEEGR